MICAYVQPTPEAVAADEFVIRLLGHASNQPSRSVEPLLAAEVLEGDCDGRRITFGLAPSLAAHFRSARQVKRLATHGACYMVRVAVNPDSQGRRKNVVTDIAFVGYEPTGLDAFDLN